MTALGGVAATAVAAARVRAAESARTDRLFDDPLAILVHRAFPAAPAAATTSPARELLRGQVVVRTRFYDEWLQDAVSAGIRQVVTLAAGFDARPFRLPLPPEVTAYDVDLPTVLEQKARLIATAGLRPNCRLVPVACDLTGEWPARLTDAGHRSDHPTAWLVEGLLVYLEPDAADRLLDELTRLSAPGSRLACERSSAGGATTELSADPGLEQVVGLWRGGPAMDGAAWVSRRGWQPTTHALAAVAAAYGRSVPAGPDRGFVTAGRGEPQVH